MKAEAIGRIFQGRNENVPLDGPKIAWIQILVPKQLGWATEGYAAKQFLGKFIVDDNCFGVQVGGDSG